MNGKDSTGSLRPWRRCGSAGWICHRWLDVQERYRGWGVGPPGGRGIGSDAVVLSVAILDLLPTAMALSKWIETDPEHAISSPKFRSINTANHLIESNQIESLGPAVRIKTPGSHENETNFGLRIGLASIGFWFFFIRM